MVDSKENYKFDLGVKGLTPMSDQHRISTNNIKYDIRHESDWTKEKYQKGIISWSNIKFSKLIS